MKRGLVLGGLMSVVALVGIGYRSGEAVRPVAAPMPVPAPLPIALAPVPRQALTAPPPQVSAPPTAPDPAAARVHDVRPPVQGCSQRDCGTETAAATTPLNARNPLWMERMHHWMEQRAAILKTPGLSPEQRNARIEQQRAQQFNAEEQAQVLTIEQANDAH